MDVDILLNALGNPTRREILQTLAEKPCCVTELSNRLNIGRKAIIEHLSMLKSLGIIDYKIKRTKRGRPRKYYYIKNDLILEIVINNMQFLTNILKYENFEKLAKECPFITDLYKEFNIITKTKNIEECEKFMKKLNNKLNQINMARALVQYMIKTLKCMMKDVKN